jgi:endonuclease/exonuclease/phosphatase (EEP) superfamily protein YafD
MWYLVLSTILFLASLLPLSNNTHWIFRAAEFGKVQLLIMQIFLVILGFLFIDKKDGLFWVFSLLTLLCVIHHLINLFEFTPLYKVRQKKRCNVSSQKVSILSANVFQENTQYIRFVSLIQKYKPDIFITMESNQDWEKALFVFENDYPYRIKVPLENTYGMHLYSRLKIKGSTVHYFVADDLPSIEAKIETKDRYTFTLFAIHPPPPSPTEEVNSKERDGELLSVAKKVRANANSSLVVGDFNNVAWSRSSKLFRKTSQMIDGRIGRGFITTFHAEYWLLRYPIDLMFHTADIFVTELRRLEYFGSDHFPLLVEFFINTESNIQEVFVEDITIKEKKDVTQIIKDGINEESTNRDES